MVVGEPSLMGGEFGDEDERLITRLENTQYDAANSLDHDSHGFPGAESPMNSVPSSWGAVPGNVSSVNNTDRSLGSNGSGLIGPGPTSNNPNNNPSSGSDSDKKSPVVSQ